MITSSEQAGLIVHKPKYIVRIKFKYDVPDKSIMANKLRVDDDYGLWVDDWCYRWIHIAEFTVILALQN